MFPCKLIKPANPSMSNLFVPIPQNINPVTRCNYLLYLLTICPMQPIVQHHKLCSNFSQPFQRMHIILLFQFCICLFTMYQFQHFQIHCSITFVQMFYAILAIPKRQILVCPITTTSMILPCTKVTTHTIVIQHVSATTTTLLQPMQLFFQCRHNHTQRCLLSNNFVVTCQPAQTIWHHIQLARYIFNLQVKHLHFTPPPS